MEKKITINNDQKLFVIPCGEEGFTCLGFQVCEDRINKLAKELGTSPVGHTIGTMDQYQTYRDLVDIARRKHVDTGWRSQSELNPKLIGLEGKRIECTVYGETVKFYVGKSTGFIPCHLEIESKKEHGGMALPCEPEKITNIRVIK